MTDLEKSTNKSRQEPPTLSEMAQSIGGASLLCPSSLPEIKGSVVFGVVGGTVETPQVAYLQEPQPVTDELLALAKPVEPTEVYRIAASCLESGCQHFDGHQCSLVQRIVAGLPAVVKDLPPCPIRQDCRWWEQEGKAACFRCPQMVRVNHYLSETTQNAIAPNVWRATF